ncbi:putative protein N(5)-glutamine methyltransferase [Amycolatopsis alkalitolerans]|uniref:peptide chain release factor N(5)-glutamine methyltransferase n=1 Tax=Amycolatopsis alkalitolerans TaxID=2547244 RepID=A0A5C4LZH6_9PSEU|nr:putative protein N(5)-glutamine methyltransferase [Amycolatopsis alkalitolerans]TNC23507.1 putative protein N(5)-glutamine methyltransferase [Amycolatopsis alkalitolerans]
MSDVVTTLRNAGCVFAEDEAALLRSAASDGAQLAALVARRVAGEPLEYVLGWAGFRGLRIAVEPGVFVPRRRTEFLVEQAIAVAGQAPVVVDVCCGSGAIGAAIAAEVPDVSLYAADVDPVAVRCARRNVPGPVFEGDLYTPLPAELRGRVTILVANVPYVPTDAIATMPPEARVHEPRAALDGGPDGLSILRRVANEAPQWLARGGHLFVETSERQAPAAVKAFSGAGLIPSVATCEDSGATVVRGERP